MMALCCDVERVVIMMAFHCYPAVCNTMRARIVVTLTAHFSCSPAGRTQGFCAMCELERHSTRAFNTPSGVMRPVPIVQNLKGWLG